MDDVRRSDAQLRSRYRAIKGASSVASRSHTASMAVGLGDARLERVEIRCASGSVVSIPGRDLELETYNDLRGSCPQRL